MSSSSSVPTTSSSTREGAPPASLLVLVGTRPLVLGERRECEVPSAAADRAAAAAAVADVDIIDVDDKVDAAALEGETRRVK